MFPFTYYENLHYSCTTDGDPDGLEWCATQTQDWNNFPLEWGHCSAGCRNIDSSSGGGGSSDYEVDYEVIDNSGDGELMDSCFTTDGIDQGTEPNVR